MDENRVEGKARGLVGKVQEQIGRAEGDLGRQVRGQLNQAAGAAQEFYGQAKDATRDRASSLDHWFRSTINTQPYLTALVVLGAGYLVGRLNRFP